MNFPKLEIKYSSFVYCFKLSLLQNHVWNVEAMLSKPELYKGSLSGSAQIGFETSNSRASFSSIQVSSYGMYIVKYHVTSVPADYDFYVEHLVTARGQHHVNMPMDETVELKLKFSENYQTVIGSEGNYAAAYLGSWFAHEHQNIEVLTSTVSSGMYFISSREKVDARLDTTVYNNIGDSLGTFLSVKLKKFVLSHILVVCH